MTLKYLILLSLFCSLSLRVALSQTTEEIELPKAKIFYVKGDVLLIDTGGNSRQAKANDYWIVGETLKTQKNSMAIVSFSGDSKTKFGPETEIVLNSLLAKYNEENIGKTSLLLKAGEMFVNFLNKSKEPVMEVKTKHVALGIRGTSFYASNEQDEFIASVDHGEVEVSSLTNSSQADALDSGEGIVVEKGNFSQPQKYEWAKKINYNPEDRKVQSQEERQSRLKNRRQEFSQKRKKWARNQQRWKQKKQRWKMAGEKYQKRQKTRRKMIQNIKSRWKKASLDQKKNMRKKMQQMKKMQKLKKTQQMKKMQQMKNGQQSDQKNRTKKYKDFMKRRRKILKRRKPFKKFGN